MKNLIAFTLALLALTACQRGVPEIWPRTYAEYQAMTAEQKADIKANCTKHGDFIKGIPLPSCFLANPIMVRNNAEAEQLYAARLREWEAYKNAQ